MNAVIKQNKGLKKQLTQFGLNPNEWSLYLGFENKIPQILFHHKEEMGLSLVGIVDFKQLKPKIKNLELLAI